MLRNLILAASALCFLGLMGQKNKIHQTPSEHQHHRDELHQGIITVASGSALQLELKQGRETWRAEYKAGEWVYGKSSLAKTDQKTLAEYLSMLENSKPVRTFHPDELESSDSSIYGFEPPRLETSVTTYRTEMPASPDGKNANNTTKSVVIRFGNATPDGSLRYVVLRGDSSLYVMSGFIFTQALDVVRVLKSYENDD